MPTFAPSNNKPITFTIMNAKLYKIYEIANKCGFDVKHREESEKVAFAFKSKESKLNLFFEVKAQKSCNAKIFAANVAHEVFLFSENIDPHTETRKYLEKIGGKLTQYTDIYSEMMHLCWQVRNLWLSL